MSLFDENAEALSNIAGKGCDLTQPRKVDFAHLFKEKAKAEAFLQEVKEHGFEAIIEDYVSGDVRWDVVVSQTMVPTCEDITALEEKLDAAARTFSGKADGWGFLEA